MSTGPSVAVTVTVASHATWARFTSIVARAMFFAFTSIVFARGAGGGAPQSSPGA